MSNPLSSSIILLAAIMASCSEPNTAAEDSTSRISEWEQKATPIEIKRAEGDRPEQAEYQEIVVRLENPMRIKSMTDSVYLTDDKTGKRYEFPFFREALGVRSSNEEQYVIKLYSDNSLYGIDPIYKDVPLPPHIQK